MGSLVMKMIFESFSILTGTEACNARCPFCVAKASPTFEGVDDRKIHWRNFNKAAQLARDTGTSTAIITSYGDPTLFPNEVSNYLLELKKFNFPLIELQTNAVAFDFQKNKYMPYITKWYEYGLDIMAISIVHYDDEINRECYVPYKKNYINLQKTVAMLRQLGYAIRLNCTMCKGWMDSPEKISKLIEFAKKIGAFQLTLRPVNMPSESRDDKITNWVSERMLSNEQMLQISDYMNTHGTVLLKKPYGAVIYDINGFNVCLTNCLTMDNDPSKVRQLIFFPNGAIRYDWQYNAVLLS